eukprot:1266136-Alexandrium_andersonii.AAC.1
MCIRDRLRPPQGRRPRGLPQVQSHPAPARASLPPQGAGERGGQTQREVRHGRQSPRRRPP